MQDEKPVRWSGEFESGRAVEGIEVPLWWPQDSTEVAPRDRGRGAASVRRDYADAVFGGVRCLECGLIFE